MASYKFVRATTANQLFTKLRKSWEKQVPAARHAWLEQRMTYPGGIAAEIPTDPKYGIYVLCNHDKNGKPRAPYSAFVHVNHAFPQTRHPVLRLVWSALAPIYETVAPDKKAKVISEFLLAALKLSTQSLRSKTVKVYLSGAVDLDFAKILANTLAPLVVDKMAVSVRGQWLHFEWKR